jgi:hypothetical protein
MQINLTGRQANFLAAFEKSFGRQKTVSRVDLINFKNTWTPGQVGPYGYTLRWPAWLTNSGTFTQGRAVYALPWEVYDSWVVNNPNPAANPALGLVAPPA